jgi:hypothetical protein
MDAKRRRIRVKVIVSLAVFVLIAAAVLIAARMNFPIREGTSADFWYAVCRVELDGKTRSATSAYPARDGWLVYGHQHFHGEWLFRVREEEAFADFPEVVKRLEEAGPRPPFIEAGLANWRQKDPQRAQPHLLIQEVRESDLDSWKQRDPSVYQFVLAKEKSVDERWSMARDWLPILVVIELIFFETLSAFVLWPWWRSARPAWYVVHLGCLPWLFLLPHWLGYAAVERTRHVALATVTAAARLVVAWSRADHVDLRLWQPRCIDGSVRVRLPCCDPSDPCTERSRPRLPEKRPRRWPTGQRRGLKFLDHQSLGSG